MKRLLDVIVILIVLSTMQGMFACRHSAPEHPLLLRADTLLMPNVDKPDSALALLQEIGELRTPQDSALYTLQLTKALCKTDRDSETDTISMERALRWYAAHGPQSRLVEAHVFAGLAHEATGNIIGAMRHYKTAELLADTTDHYSIGYIYLRLATLCHDYTRSYSLIVSHYRQAIHHFMQVDSCKYLNYAIADLGGIYRMNNCDSAAYFLYQAHRMALGRHDTTMINNTEFYLAGLYYRVKQYDSLVYYARRLESRGLLDEYTAICPITSRAYSKLNKLDSAIYYLKKSRPANGTDSTEVLVAQSLIYQALGDTAAANIYRLRADSLNDAELLKLTKKPLLEQGVIPVITAQAQKEKLAHERSKKRIYIALAIVVVALVLLVAGLLYYKKRKEQILFEQLVMAQHRINDITAQLNRLETEQAHSGADSQHLEASIKRFRSLLQEQNKILSDSLHRTITKRTGKSAHNNLNDYTLATSITADNDFWASISELTEALYPGALKHLRSVTPPLNDQDIRMVLLIGMDFPDYMISLYLGFSNTRSVDNRRRKLIQALNIDCTIKEWLENYSMIHQIR